MTSTGPRDVMLFPPRAAVWAGTVKCTSSKKHWWKYWRYDKRSHCRHGTLMRSSFSAPAQWKNIESLKIENFVSFFCNCCQTAHMSHCPSLGLKMEDILAVIYKRLPESNLVCVWEAVCMGSCGAWTYSNPAGIMMPFTFHVPCSGHDAVKHVANICRWSYRDYKLTCSTQFELGLFMCNAKSVCPSEK